jgi:hypothetical protein
MNRKNCKNCEHLRLSDHIFYGHLVSFYCAHRAVNGARLIRRIGLYQQCKTPSWCPLGTQKETPADEAGASGIYCQPKNGSNTHDEVIIP